MSQIKFRPPVATILVAELARLTIKLENWWQSALKLI